MVVSAKQLKGVRALKRSLGETSAKVDGAKPVCLDVTSFEALFMAHARPLASYLYTLLQDWNATEEAVQETFFRLWKHPWKSKPDKTLIFSIGRNYCIDLLRRRDSLVLQLDEEEYETRPATFSDQPEEITLVSEKRQELRGAMLQLLPERLRTVVVLDLQQFTNAEIAAVLDVVVGTVKNRRTEAHILLRDHPELLEVGNER
jgi:RNA polymerase sigma-70 factor (ECF subfamily)